MTYEKTEIEMRNKFKKWSCCSFSFFLFFFSFFFCFFEFFIFYLSPILQSLSKEKTFTTCFCEVQDSLLFFFSLKKTSRNSTILWRLAMIFWYEKKKKKMKIFWMKKKYPWCKTKNGRNFWSRKLRTCRRMLKLKS